MKTYDLFTAFVVITFLLMTLPNIPQAEKEPVEQTDG